MSRSTPIVCLQPALLLVGADVGGKRRIVLHGGEKSFGAQAYTSAVLSPRIIVLILGVAGSPADPDVLNRVEIEASAGHLIQAAPQPES